MASLSQGRWSRKEPVSRHWITSGRYSHRDIPNNYRPGNVEGATLKSHNYTPCTKSYKRSPLTLPEIQLPNTQRKLESKRTEPEVHYVDEEAIEYFDNQTQMESVESMELESYLSITDSVSQLSFHSSDDEHVSDDSGVGNAHAPCMSHCGTNGSLRSLRVPVARPLQPATLNCKENPPQSSDSYIRGIISAKFGEGPQSLPPLKTCDYRRHSVHELPIITVQPEEESRAKDSQHDASLDPRFLMPTETSVQEARYLLATKRGSFPSLNRMRRRSLDMVIEEHPTPGATVHDAMTLTVPRHRIRSRSLDGGIETKNSFAAFKESLKVRTVKKTRLGT